MLHLGHDRSTQGRRLLAPGAVLHSLVAALPDQLSVSPRDTILPVVPMFHANVCAAALAGARLVLPGPRLDAHSVLDILAGEHVTTTAGVPTVWMAMRQRSTRNRPVGTYRPWTGWSSAAPRCPGRCFEGFDSHGLAVI